MEQILVGEDEAGDVWSVWLVWSRLHSLLLLLSKRAYNQVGIIAEPLSK